MFWKMQPKEETLNFERFSRFNLYIYPVTDKLMETIILPKSWIV